MQIEKITFIGAGSMAEAIIAGIVKKNFLPSDQIIVTNRGDQTRLQTLEEKYGIKGVIDKEEAIQDASMIVLAMKPRDIESAIHSFKDYLNEDQIIVSVAAGVPTDTIKETVRVSNPIIRIMPNTSASIGASATAIAKGPGATDQHISLCEALFRTIGSTIITDEASMHAVTAVSGSGPAYIYYLVEAMEKAAVEMGLDDVTAKELITQTVIGAGEMLKTSGESAKTLREKVTSPGGTTEAGLKALDKYEFERAIKACVQSANDRSVEIGKN